MVGIKHLRGRAYVATEARNEGSRRWALMSSCLPISLLRIPILGETPGASTAGDAPLRMSVLWSTGSSQAQQWAGVSSPAPYDAVTRVLSWEVTRSKMYFSFRGWRKFVVTMSLGQKSSRGGVSGHFWRDQNTLGLFLEGF